MVYTKPVLRFTRGINGAYNTKFTTPRILYIDVVEELILWTCFDPWKYFPNRLFSFQQMGHPHNGPLLTIGQKYQFYLGSSLQTTCITEYTPGERDLKGLVASNERSQFSQRLFAGTSHSDQESVAAWCTDDTRYLDEMDHSVLEEDQVHSRATNTLVVLLEEHP